VSLARKSSSFTPVQKRIVLTGATRGLGRALTSFFASEGWIVFGCGRDAAAIEKLRKAHPAPHQFEIVDVSNDATVASWAASCPAPPDLLVNNAAVIARTAPLWQLPPAETDPVIDVNIKGTISTIRHFLPGMIRRGSGIVVNLSSGWGRSTSPEVATYCASKFAVEGLTAALAQELPKGLAAVALNPGIIATDMLKACFGGEANSYPTPETWIRSAGPFLLGLRPSDNGKQLTVPEKA